MDLSYRGFEQEMAQLSRLFTRPSGLFLLAHDMNCARLILDTVPQTVYAQKLYEAMGFQQIAPYYANPVPGTKFYQLALTASANAGA